MRFILLIIAIVLGYLIVRQLLKGKKSSRPQIPDATRMVRCEHCGLHVPLQDSTEDNGHYFCSDEHRKLHQS